MSAPACPSPVLSELAALHASLARQQQECSLLAAQLADNHIAASRAISNAAILSHANHSLQAEINVLRAAPPFESVLRTLPPKQWSIALRRAADKFDHLESTLRSRLSELQAANAACYKQTLERDEALSLLSRIQEQRDDDLRSVREFHRSINLLREEKVMMELAMSDYADLVRSLTASPPSSPLAPRPSPSRTLSQGLSGLSRLFSEHASETELLHDQVSRLQSELDGVKIELLAEQDYHSQVNASLIDCETKLSLMQADDSAASKVVSRYMKFSQDSTNSLQQALIGLRSRHASTVQTLETQNSVLQQHLNTEEVAHEHTQRLLSDAQSELLYEQASFRREVGLRIKSIDQMARLLDLLDRLSGKYRPALQNIPRDNDGLHALFTALVNDIERLRTEFGQPDGSHAQMLYEYIDQLQEQYQLNQPDPLQSATFIYNSTITHPEHDTPSQIPSDHSKTAIDDKGNHSQSAVRPRSTSDVPEEGLNQHGGPDPPASGHKEDSKQPTPTPILTKKLSSAELDDEEDRSHELGQISDSEPAEGTPSGSEIAPVDAAEVAETQPSASPSPVKPTSPVPLLTQLSEVTSRYDGLQKSLYASHLAIQKLKEFQSKEVSDAHARFDSPTTKQFLMVINRLDDYNEDTRVELEIAIADEGRAAQGFMALAVLPDTPDAPDSSWKCDAATFLSDEYSPFRTTFAAIQRKLEDIKHDLGILQEQLHLHWANPTSSNAGEEPQPSSWTSWANGVLSPSSSRPSSPSPSFGMVISSRSNRQQLYPGLAPKSLDISSLGLRISNPAVQQVTAPSNSSLPGRLFGANRTNSFGLGLSRTFSPLSRRAGAMTATTASSHDLSERGLETTESDGEDDSDVE